MAGGITLPFIWLPTLSMGAVIGPDTPAGVGGGFIDRIETFTGGAIMSATYTGGAGSFGTFTGGANALETD